MYVRDPLRVVVTGPLLPYADGFCAELARRGYSPAGAAELVQLMAHLSRWLGEQQLVPAALTGEVVERFLADRRQQYRKLFSGRALVPLLVYLHGVGAVSEPARRVDDSDAALLVDRYRRYLVHERGLATVSIRRYMPTVGRFLAQVPTPIEVGLKQLSAAQVTQLLSIEPPR